MCRTEARLAIGGISLATEWDDYVAAPDATSAFRTCRQAHAPTFAKLRESIQHVARLTAPKTVACLGAGLLNDIPYGHFVENSETVHLVDWIPGIVDQGLVMSSVERDDKGQSRCIYCALSDERATRYCRGFAGSRDVPGGVCRNFRPAEGGIDACEAFERGEQPIVEVGDVTAGFATAFGRGANAELDSVRTWRQALRRGSTLSNKLKRHRTPLGIADSSVDLVTSSMVVSQFSHEPYDYYSKQAAVRLGTPTPREERALKSAAGSLRSLLAREQVMRHRDEIERILAPKGVCFLAFELYHYDDGIAQCFLVQEMLEALSAFAATLTFRFDLLPQGAVMREFETPMGKSLVHCVVLQRREGSQG